MINFINRKLADPGFMFIGLLSLALGCIAAGVITPTIIEANRKQCANRDWPLDKDQMHIDFCHAEGHEVGKLGPGF